MVFEIEVGFAAFMHSSNNFKYTICLLVHIVFKKGVTL